MDNVGDVVGAIVDAVTNEDDGDVVDVDEITVIDGVVVIFEHVMKQILLSFLSAMIIGFTLSEFSVFLSEKKHKMLSQTRNIIVHFYILNSIF